MKKEKTGSNLGETSSKSLVIPIVSVYSSHQFRECDKYLFESSIGTYSFSGSSNFNEVQNIGYSDTVIYYIELLFKYILKKICSFF